MIPRDDTFAERNGKKLIALTILLILGMLIALYLLYEHFSPTPSKFCTFGESFDCNIVNKSPYANLDGISYLLTIEYRFPLPLLDISGAHWLLNLITANAFLGFLALLLLLLMIHAYAHERAFLGISTFAIQKLITGVFILSIPYALYLLYIQHFILKTYCILCLALDAVIFISFFIWLRCKHG